MKSNYVGRAKKFMEQFLKYVGDIDLMSENVVRNAVLNYNIRYHRNVVYEYGSCRNVLIISDYVIKWDYNDERVEEFGGCVQEYENWLAAIEDGYDYLFAAVTPIQVCGKTWYVMPRIPQVGKVYISIFDFLNREETDWVDEHVWDIHEYNYGMRKGKPVIVDYAATRKH